MQTHDRCGAQNLPTKGRPQEVTVWIRSKKKDVVPSLKPDCYGKLFTGWWTMMQPSWRKEGESLTCNVPQGETWQTLRKGGTASIYIVIIGLSWWIGAQHARCDVDAWKLVDDLVWVFHEMKEAMALSPRK